MYKCQICGREFKTSKGLSLHLTRGEKVDKSKYYDEYVGRKEGEGFCLTCGRPTRFENFDVGYFRFCCVECVNRCEKIREKNKQTCIDRYGFDSPRKSESVKAKARATNLERYGVENPSQSEEVKEKIRQTNLERHGVACVLQLEEVKEKSKKAILERYGVENPSQSEEVKEKMRQTWIRNHGVDNPSKSEKIKQIRKDDNLCKYGVAHTFQREDVKSKCRVTLKKNYGVYYPSQSPEIQKQIKETCLHNLGVENPSQSEEVKERKKQKSLENWGFEFPIQHDEIKKLAVEGNISKYGVTSFSKLDSERKRISELARLRMIDRLFNSDRLKDKVIPKFSKDEYKNVETKHLWECTKCGNVFEDHLDDGHIPRCPTCYPSTFGPSMGEKEVGEFIESLEFKVETNVRYIITPKELDIYIPSHNLAIEFDGLYWHSELNGDKDKKYHLNKTLMCQEKGIQLIHIFEDEWINQQNIVKSIIKSKLGLLTNRIYARKCQIQSIPNDEANLFLFDNHLQGPINGKHLGLYYNDELVSILSYSRPRFNKKYEYEILRFCSKVNHSVVGALSKLLKRLNPDKTIISYADRRYGEGQGYLKCGFTQIGSSEPSFYYIKNNQKYNRLQFQKHLLEEKLENYDPNLTAWENMQLNDYDRIWDCGTNVLLRSK